MTDLSEKAPPADLLGEHQGPAAKTSAGSKAADLAKRHARRLPYRYAEVHAAIARSDAVWVADLPADVDALVAVGVEACCAPDGLASWSDEDSGTLAGARSVFVVTGSAAAAVAHGWRVASSLCLGGVTSAVPVAVAPAEHVGEYLQRGGQLADFEVREAPPAGIGFEIDLRGDAAVRVAEVSSPWPDPEPLEWAAGFRPPFPVEALPPWIRRYVLAVADHLQVPVDLPATLAIGALTGRDARKAAGAPAVGVGGVHPHVSGFGPRAEHREVGHLPGDDELHR